ncbi:MAG: putative glycolipid-binding domain-containing protein [Beijerinckiaceae bacterium]|nr:putative glycolipid-binding domain-containing protein [Beijerinckiaceae bacterium]
MAEAATAFWRRLDAPGRDAARVSKSATGYELLGQAVLLDSRGPTALRYTLDLAPDWSTRQGHATGFSSERVIDNRIIRTPAGWKVDGKEFGMAEVVDLDLGFTPATNMLQLNRVRLSVGDTVNLDVAWLDAGEEVLVRLLQKYRRTSTFDCDYSSPALDYRATIVLARTGFAAVYPDLWEIKA